MAPEVINLLSSSPPLPSPTNVGLSEPPKASFKISQAPSRGLNPDDDDFFDVTPTSVPNGVQKSMAPTAKEPAAGTKRNNAGHCRRHDNNSLFFSDDFDTTGDLDYNVTKKARVSPVAAEKKEVNGRSMTRRTSAIVGTKLTGPLQPAGLRGWNSVADPIECSSSPIDLTLDKDPFASSPEDRVAHKRLAEPSQDSLTECATKVTSKKPSTKSTKFFDLTSDIFGSSPQPPVARTKSPKQKASWDPISSSMPDMHRSHEHDPFASSPPQAQKRKADVIDLDESDASNSEDEFPDINAIDVSKARANMRTYSESPRKKPKTALAKRRPPKTIEERELDKRRKAEAREAEQERKRIEKERAKEQKAMEKEQNKALAEVNKVRTDKKVSTPEMIVDLPLSLAPGISLQVRTLLEDLNVQHGTWQSPIDHVVKWRRKVESVWNDDLGIWEPIPLRIKAENHILVIITAAEFVKLALGIEGVDLEAHVLEMKVKFPGNTFIYLIEGLPAWSRKNRSVRNRQFQSAVRNDAAPSSSQARRRNAQHEIVDEDAVEEALISLQVDHDVLVHETNVPVETAQWISVFTQHISTIPYRKARDLTNASAGFCMESGQVKTGDGPRDTYIRMLQEVARVTAPMAYGIAVEYATVTDLVQGFEENGPLALEKCKKSANKDGALTDRTVGQAVSRRLYKIFTGKDASSTDI
ncbi:ERCC4 domain-containing protein [Xylariales sp. AK1849]|nr:ERCC4 domain-containing protein [Xylariales sp. AK1849]